MAQALRDTNLTPADELRVLLSESEKLVVSLRGRGAESQELLDNLDRIAELWPQLEAAGVDLRPEEGRRDTLYANVHASAPTLLREMSAAGGLAAARARVHGDGQAGWWWYLDQEVAQRRMQRSRKAITSAVVVAAIVALGYLLITRLFPVDPAVQASTAAMMTGQQRVEEGDLAGALASFQAATNAMPDDPEAWVWSALVQEKLGQSDASKESLARARVATNDEVVYHTLRAQVYLTVGMNVEAKAEAMAALALDPENPQANFALAGAYESLGQMDKAVETMQKASDYAEARGQTELTVIARYRLALLMQQSAMQPPPPATP